MKHYLKNCTKLYRIDVLYKREQQQFNSVYMKTRTSTAEQYVYLCVYLVSLIMDFTAFLFTQISFTDENTKKWFSIKINISCTLN